MNSYVGDNLVVKRDYFSTSRMSAQPGMLSGDGPMDLVLKVAHQSHVYKLALYFERASAGMPSALPANSDMLGEGGHTIELGPFTARNG